MRNAIVFLLELKDVGWSFGVKTLWGGCPWEVESDMRERMDEHKFDSNMPALFTILTPGKGEDGWTPKVNGMINCSEQIDVDPLGFLTKNVSDEVSNTQRLGRAGRVANSLVLQLGQSVASSSTWCMPYATKLQVKLAATERRFHGDIPGLSVAQQTEVESDLVTGDIMFKMGALWDPADLSFLSFSFGNP